MFEQPPWRLRAHACGRGVGRLRRHMPPRSGGIAAEPVAVPANMRLPPSALWAMRVIVFVPDCTGSSLANATIRAIHSMTELRLAEPYQSTQWCSSRPVLSGCGPPRQAGDATCFPDWLSVDAARSTRSVVSLLTSVVLSVTLLFSTFASSPHRILLSFPLQSIRLPSPSCHNLHGQLLIFRPTAGAANGWRI